MNRSTRYVRSMPITMRPFAAFSALACVSLVLVPALFSADLIETHLNATTGIPSCSADDAAPDETLYDELICGFEGCSVGAYDDSICYGVYKQGATLDFFPGIDQHFGTNFSLVKLGDLAIDDFTTAVNADLTDAGFPAVGIDFLDHVEPGCTDPVSLCSESAGDTCPNIQILHGFRLATPWGPNNEGHPFLSTVILPQNFSLSKQGGYPIVVFSNWDLNAWMFTSGGQVKSGVALTEMVAMSTTGNLTGAIGVIWNGGGSSASRTISPLAHQQFRDLLAHIETSYNGNPNLLFMYGGSRGGIATLSLGSNPALESIDSDPNTPGAQRGNYRTRFIAVNAALGWIGSRKKDLTLDPTYPVSYRNVSDDTGFHDAWRTPEQSEHIDTSNDWSYPGADSGEVCFGRPTFSDFEGADPFQAEFSVLTGRQVRTQADFDCLDEGTVDCEPVSAGSTLFMDGLAAQGTEVFIEVGTHDRIPYVLKMDYAQKLDGRFKTLGVIGDRVEVEVLLAGGHARRWGDNTNLPLGLREIQRERVWRALDSFLLPTPGIPSTLLSALKLKFYEAGCEEVGGVWDYAWDGVLLDPRNSQGDVIFPFSMEGPARLWKGQEFSLVFAGHPETDYTVRVVTNDPLFPPVGEVLLEHTGELPLCTNPGCGTFPFTFNIEHFDTDDLAGVPSGAEVELKYELDITLPGDTQKTLTLTPSRTGTAEAKLFYQEPDAEGINLSGLQLFEEFTDLVPACLEKDQTNWGIYEELFPTPRL